MAIHWISGPIPGRLGIMPVPRSGEWLEDEIAQWSRDGVHLVVSLLEAQEIAALDLAKEAYLCQKYSIAFLTHPFPDRGVPPSAEETGALIQKLKSHLQNRKTAAIHCRSGIGRSGLIAACVLRSFGVEAKKAFEIVASARGFMVPDTNQQREWVAAFNAGSALTP